MGSTTNGLAHAQTRHQQPFTLITSKESKDRKFQAYCMKATAIVVCYATLKHTQGYCSTISSAYVRAAACHLSGHAAYRVTEVFVCLLCIVLLRKHKTCMAPAAFVMARQRRSTGLQASSVSSAPFSTNQRHTFCTERNPRSESVRRNPSVNPRSG